MKIFVWIVLLFQITSLVATKSIILTKRQMCDLELIMNGGFAPLQGFMNSADYERVVVEMRLADGNVWPIPITLDIDEEFALGLTLGEHLLLKSSDGTTLADLQVEDLYKPNKMLEAQYVYTTTSLDHPGVNYLLHKTKEFYVGGSITKIAMPVYCDFMQFRKSPQQLKELFRQQGYDKVVAFQTRNPMHRAHYELTRRAVEQIGGHLLIHPVVGLTKPGDIDYVTRVHCYKAVYKKYPKDLATLSLLPLSMRMAGPREALWHALIRKNYGCTHFIVGRDHAGPGPDRYGNNFYEPYDAQDMVRSYQDEIGITMIPFQEMQYVESEDTYYPADQVPLGAEVKTISGTQLRAALYSGTEIPEWFSFPEVVFQLRRACQPKHRRGITIFLTGLSAAGKSTIAQALLCKLSEIDQHRKISILDGDIIRQNLSQGLGFSKKDRSINVRRAGFVASEITKHGGVAICALIAPYEEDRMFNRQVITEVGNYIEVYVSTPLEVCQERDPKGLYSTTTSHMTGVSDPYEIPKKPDLIIDTTKHSVDEEVSMIIDHLYKEGLLIND
jgi:sulfate adenylyltransferase